MRIAICDDETICLEYLKEVIERFSVTQNVPINIEVFHNAEEMLFETGDTTPYDLLILDIQMGKMNGMELAKRIRKTDPNVYIVFLTGVADYVYDGYEVGALRYLLKPLKEKQLYNILSDVISRLESNENQYLIIKINRENVKISLDDIIFIEAMGHYVIIHTEDKVYDVKMSINNIENEIHFTFFIRVHRSYIVNIKHVDKINKENCVLSNNDTVNVSRGNYNKLNEAFINYYRGI
ncbi:response regulator transcription factor [Mycoplasmatota bacterium]|nr:response regulator transcription factor [Mycoplasmatota bacterium]